MSQSTAGVPFEQWASEMMADSTFVAHVSLQQPGFLIARARNSRGLTQEALAKLAEISPQTLAHIETGSYIPSWKLFCRLANVLGAGISLDLQFG